jgi:hypothetical protein
MNATRRTAAAASALALAALVGAVGPAHAIIKPVPTPFGQDWKLVTAVSVSDGLAKSVTASCPAGMQVVGSGGRIVDTGYEAGEAGISGGRMTIDDITPDATLSSVTVTGGIRDQANWDPAVDTFQVEAKAWCARTAATPALAAVVNGLTRVAATSPDNGTSATEKTAVAACPVGLTVYGTGFELTGADGKVFVNDVLPDAGLTSVTVTAYNDLLNANGWEFVGPVQPTPFTGVWDLTGYAICGQSRGQDVLLSSYADSYGVMNVNAQAPQCTAGTLLTGAGIDIGQSLPGPSWVALKKLGLAAHTSREDPRALATALNRATMFGSSEFTNLWWVTTYSICH